MRPLACYSFETENPGKGFLVRDSINAITKSWLDKKGHFIEALKGNFKLNDGRVASLTQRTVTTKKGFIDSLYFNEPHSDGRFSTEFTMGSTEDINAISCKLLGDSGGFLRPVEFDARRPLFLLNILRNTVEWRYQGTLLHTQPQYYNTLIESIALNNYIWDNNRSLPIVTISADDSGNMLHPDIATNIASDLSGLATVCVLSPNASWQITKSSGKYWSCYDKAIRIYWPYIRKNINPYVHKLWLYNKLMYNVANELQAALRIQNQIRNIILSVSCFTVLDPEVINNLWRTSRNEEFEAYKSLLTKGENYREISEEYFKKMVEQEEYIDVLEKTNADLVKQNNNLQASLRWKEEVKEEVVSEKEVIPESPGDAIIYAAELYKDTLIIGSDVWSGVQNVVNDSSLALKIWKYITALSDMTHQLQNQPLGVTQIQWLKERGFEASSESDTILNNKVEMKKRTWDAGGEKSEFHFHMKVTEATSPDKCVRIYCKYDKKERKTIIGWVGRHP